MLPPFSILFGLSNSLYMSSFSWLANPDLLAVGSLGAGISSRLLQIYCAHFV